ncbi:MAG: hypothetical protein Fur0037_09210 [Planctomycetota bacterium]
MRSQLSHYCRLFDEVVRPVLPLFQATVEAIEASTQDAIRHDLEDLRHQIEVLADKVRDQKAFVLIFGPLKSGKSTLMNALAGTWVSEVSALPAYPCLVFTSPSKRREYVVSRYDGGKKSFQDADSLHRHIQEAHARLADGIRAAEAAGEVFDPLQHYPEAIRRIDVLVPGSRLDETGAVLVDTPGLYTRMRFGYDRMTREFRNAAACAVFVVKSDTLFLEQVFAEFHELLDLFSRVFLVVNVDSRKCDVGPDGKLLPSLEQTRPGLILDAFQKLAMSAPLHRAAAEGRVRMFAVDLLRAASQALSSTPESARPEDFRSFAAELRDYLASADYLMAFLRDSLRRGSALAERTAALLRGDVLARLRRDRADASDRVESLRGRASALSEALARPFPSLFGKWHETLLSEAQRSARDEAHKLLRALGASIDTWFLSGHGLDWLLSDQWGPLFRTFRGDVAAALRRVFEQSLGQEHAALEVDRDLERVLRQCDIDLRSLRAEAESSLGSIEWIGDDHVPVDVRAIPVRKGLLDLVAFRSPDRIRERLFGPLDEPTRKLSARDKASRLGEPGRLFLHQQVSAFRARVIPDTVRSIVRHYGERLQEATIFALERALRSRLPALEEELQRAERRLASLDAVLSPADRLLEAASSIPPKLEALGIQFGAHWKEETGPVLEPAPRADPRSASRARS